MLFNSTEYLCFFVFVCLLYWVISRKPLINQNILLLAASYVFYSWWDYRFLGLILISTVSDFIIAKKIYITKNINIRKFFLVLSLVINIGLLAFFKYYNFFLDSWVKLLTSIGYQVNSITTLSIILPVGISFYTFQTLSYTLDVYYKRFKPTSSFLNFSTFVALFPQLVAGPIERAKNLLPQIEQKRSFSIENLRQGLTLILWGLFKKVVVADSLAPLVDEVFDNPSSYNGGTLFLGLFYFTFQIYCDFSGYSDIAIGTAKCFGFKFMSNFNYPYFAKDISDFWRRWHISLSSWFRDYIFIPLGGSKVMYWQYTKNILIVFFLSGLWHGPNWTFVFWGLTHSIIYFVMRDIKIVPSTFKYKSQTTGFFTFMAVMLSWVFFRSPSISFAFDYLYDLIVTFSFPKYPIKGLFYICILLFFDYVFKSSSQNILKGMNPFKKKVIVVILVAFVWVHFSAAPKNFIYFQF